MSLYTLPSNSLPLAWNTYLKLFFEIPISRIFPPHIVLVLRLLQEACPGTKQHQALLNHCQGPCTIVSQNSGKNLISPKKFQLNQSSFS